jgi:preprotein translocase subunit SecG
MPRSRILVAYNCNLATLFFLTSLGLAYLTRRETPTNHRYGAAGSALGMAVA